MNPRLALQDFDQGVRKEEIKYLRESRQQPSDFA
jgi:hypothetical protein